MLDVSTGALTNSDVNDAGDEIYKNDKIDDFRIV
jgi:hypothetical protein